MKASFSDQSYLDAYANSVFFDYNSINSASAAALTSSPNSPNFNVPSSLFKQLSPQQEWQLASCEQLQPFLCQKEACPIGNFHCANGKCINNQFKCDLENDCGFRDNSDEIDCPKNCHYLLQSPGEKIQSPNFPLRYESNANCLWSIGE